MHLIEIAVGYPAKSVHLDPHELEVPAPRLVMRAHSPHSAVTSTAAPAVGPYPTEFSRVAETLKAAQPSAGRGEARDLPTVRGLSSMCGRSRWPKSSILPSVSIHPPANPQGSPSLICTHSPSTVSTLTMAPFLSMPSSRAPPAPDESEQKGDDFETHWCRQTPANRWIRSLLMAAVGHGGDMAGAPPRRRR